MKKLRFFSRCMPETTQSPMSLSRALLVLGRASNLPTVWSNCLVAFVLGGGDPWAELTPILIGATLFYLGGMYLNDAFDVGFDRQFCQERPIPSGAISERTVWILGAGQLFLGFICFSVLSHVPLSLSLLMVSTILVYNALHKAVSYSPVLMSLCRLVLFLCVATIGQAGITGIALWSAIALAGYIIGLSYVARRESTGGLIAFWPCLLLVFPAVLTLLVNDGPHRGSGLLMVIGFAAWILHCLRHIYWSAQPNIGRAVSHLLAGIVIVDLMALGTEDPGQATLMVILFVSALVFQRFIPAT